MRIALLSDIHANREALDACLAFLARRGADRVVLLGDIVGYGADPAYATDVAAMFAEDGAIILKGNHDAAIGEADVDMNAVALRAIDWTRERLDKDQAAFLSALPLTATAEDVLLVHANGYAPGDWDYVLGPRQAELCMTRTAARVTFCGHTHVPALYHYDRLGPARHHQPVMDHETPLSARRQWVGVIGAVGQPRDGLPAAGCAFYDTEERVLTMHRVPYDAEAAARKVLAAGLPPVLAERLVRGR